MKREIAEQIVAAMRGMDQAIDQLDVAIRTIEDESERRRMLKFIASIVHELHMQVTLAVVKEYPDLHPEFLRT